jgi:hypothetical protein
MQPPALSRQNVCFHVMTTTIPAIVVLLHRRTELPLAAAPPLRLHARHSAAAAVLLHCSRSRASAFLAACHRAGAALAERGGGGGGQRWRSAWQTRKLKARMKRKLLQLQAARAVAAHPLRWAAVQPLLGSQHNRHHPEQRGLPCCLGCRRCPFVRGRSIASLRAAAHNIQGAGVTRAALGGGAGGAALGGGGGGAPAGPAAAAPTARTAEAGAYSADSARTAYCKMPRPHRSCFVGLGGGRPNMRQDISRTAGKFKRGKT